MNKRCAEVRILTELIIWALETGHNKRMILIDDLVGCLGAVIDDGVRDDSFD